MGRAMAGRGMRSGRARDGAPSVGVFQAVLPPGLGCPEQVAFPIDGHIEELCLLPERRAVEQWQLSDDRAQRRIMRCVLVSTRREHGGG